MTSSLLAQTAIPRHTGGWRLIGEPRPEPEGAWTSESGTGEARGEEAVPLLSVGNEGPDHEGRERLRAAVEDRLWRDMGDVMGRLEHFLLNAGRAGVVNLALVLSESFVTQELWREPRASLPHRSGLIHALGLPAETDTASLLRTLIHEVRRAFTTFYEGPRGEEALRQYDDVLERYELAEVMLVVGGHDGGPMLGELARQGVQADPYFTRSLLLDPRVPAVGAGAALEGEILVADLNPSQLALLIAQLRHLNPRITNRQVRHVLVQVLGEVKNEAPRTLGRAHVERMQELARQLLKFKTFEHFCP